MIEVATEHLLTLAQAACLIPGRPSVATLWRWRVKGVKGRKLESTLIGGKVYTSVEAIQRFALQQGGHPDETAFRTPRSRAHAISRAEQALDDAGI